MLSYNGQGDLGTNLEQKARRPNQLETGWAIRCFGNRVI
jgi:hypothetical protein